MIKNNDLFIANQNELKKLTDTHKEIYNSFFQYLLNNENDTLKVCIYASMFIDKIKEMDIDELKTINKDFKMIYLKIKKDKKGIKQKEQQIIQVDNEKFVVAGIWEIIMLTISLMYISNVYNKNFLINSLVDGIISAFALAIAIRSFNMRRTIYKRYSIDKKYIKMEIFTLIFCVIMKLLTGSQIDISFLLLVIMYFYTKKNVNDKLKSLI